VFCNIPRREQWASANQAYLEALSQDTDLFLAATDNLLALKMTAEKSALKDSLAQARLLLDVKNAGEFLALLRHVGHPAFEKTVTYGCVFYDLLTQIQAQVWRLAEIRSSGLNESLIEPQTKSTNSEHSGSNAGLEVARSVDALMQFSRDAMKSTGKQLAAMMERNVIAMTIASVQISKTAKNEVEVFLRERP
jgi:phasin family protein